MDKKKRQPWNPLLCSYPDSEKINKLSFEAETLYTRLLAKSDDNANFDANPALLMCGILAKRFDSGMIDIKKTERLRDELIEAGLIKMFKVNGNLYCHILHCIKHLRADIKPDVRFPQDIDSKELIENVSDTGRKRIENVSDTGENLSSDTNTNTNTNTNTCQKLTLLLFQKIRERKPDFKQPNIKQWERYIDLMIRIDNRKPEIIEKVIIWCQADCGDGGRWKGWQNNILSTAKLREKFDKLELSMTRAPQSQTPKPKTCFVCHKPTNFLMQTGNGKQGICDDCGGCLAKSPPYRNFKQQVIPINKLNTSQLENMILKQKAAR